MVVFISLILDSCQNIKTLLTYWYRSEKNPALPGTFQIGFRNIIYIRTDSMIKAFAWELFCDGTFRIVSDSFDFTARNARA